MKQKAGRRQEAKEEDGRSNMQAGSYLPVAGRSRPWAEAVGRHNYRIVAGISRSWAEAAGRQAGIIIGQ
jgi:hypothetical protein